MTRLLSLASGIFLAATTVSASAQTGPLERRAGDAVDVLTGKQKAEDVFAPMFLAQVDSAKIAALAAQLQAENGAIEGLSDPVAESATTIAFTIRFAKATAAARLVIETSAPNKVIGFRIGAVTPLDDTLDRVAADFAALPGRAGFAIVSLGNTPTTVKALRGDEQFAIGSAFKLWVLDALAEEVAGRRRLWDEVVPLGPKSLPSGLTQDWPAATPMTVESLAILMISRSDNTATDTLIRLIGRYRLAARVRATGHSAPAKMLPFLTTAEAFALKLGDPARREAYAEGDDAAQAKILGGLDSPAEIAKADVAALDGRPTAIDTIEWLASPTDLARVLDSLRRRADPRVRQVLAVAPALPPDQRSRFAYVGYKGGSEPGVLDLTWLLRDRAGAWTVVTASWNDPEKAVDDARFHQLALRLIHLVR